MSSTTSAQRAASGPQRRRVVVGVSGSISAYKAPTIIRLLRAAGCEVKVVPTEAALNFIGAPALAAVSGHPVLSGVFDDPAAVEHVAVAEWADLVLVAPASADLLARAAAGRANDLLTATLLTTTSPVVMAPAMHTQMWLHPATQSNVATLRRRGVRVIDPDVGPLTGGDVGPGRLPQEASIVETALACLHQGSAPQDQDLAGWHFVVSAGGTREPLDPVRFLGNRSSGRQGIAIAAAAAQRGAQVTLVCAHVESHLLAQLPSQVEVVTVSTALQMRQAVRHAASSADAVIMAAAVADFRPAQVAPTKMKKHPGRAESGAGGPGDASDTAGQPSVTLTLVENPDILAELVSDPPRRDGRCIVVGFAAETGDETAGVVDYGAAKARRKGAHLLAVNAVGEGIGFGDVPNTLIFLDSSGRERARAQGTKSEVAHALIDQILSLKA